MKRPTRPRSTPTLVAKLQLGNAPCLRPACRDQRLTQKRSSLSGAPQGISSSFGCATAELHSQRRREGGWGLPTVAFAAMRRLVADAALRWGGWSLQDKGITKLELGNERHERESCGLLAGLASLARALPGCRALTALVVFAACLCIPDAANASWWNKQWTIREKISVDTSSTGAAISEAVAGAPILVRLHAGNFQFDQANPDGADIRFVTEDDKTALPYHIAQFDSAVGEAFVWVRVPEVKPGAQTSIWLYYGNPTAASAENAKETYDANTALVWHFGERGQPAHDSSGNENNAGGPGIPAEGTLIGTGLRFDGNTAVTVPASPSLAWPANGALTWSAWVKPTSIDGRQILFSRRDKAGNAFLVGADKGVPLVEIDNGGKTVTSPSAAPLAANTWHHLVVVADGPHVVLYVDGDSYATLAAGIPALDAAAALGGERAAPDAPVTSGFTGEVVEFQVSKTARSASFIKLLAASQGGDSGANVVRFGEEEHSKGGHGSKQTGYFTVIVQSLTVDGWVVICILAVMSAISLATMVLKNRYITAALKGNQCFNRLFEERVADDLTVLESAETQHLSSSVGGELTAEESRLVDGSPLYRLYHIGAREIRKRLAAEEREGRHSRKPLSGASINAIAVSMDAGRAREVQRLQKWMVLLTIAISGGPFLGLLGTVVGVMITFAAVALAGDVNVNAIAPGIAAALLSTVAGLAVAIPALFGYNYLLSRLKEVTVDMQCFVDEFIAKVTEFYSKRREKAAATVESVIP